MSAYKTSASARPSHAPAMAEHELQESEAVEMTQALITALPPPASTMTEEHELGESETAEKEALIAALPPPAVTEEYELQTLETAVPDDASAMDVPSAEDLELVYLPKVDDPLGDNARVWRIYRFEKTKQEGLITDGWNKSLDALLTFAGLFSAALTSFLIDSYKRIQPSSDDYAPNDGSNEALNSVWFSSLGVTLAAALACLISKSWIREYELLLLDAAASPGSWVDRQVRYRAGMQLYAVPLFTSILPYLIHGSLIYFFLGFVFFALDLDWDSTSPVKSLQWFGTILGVFYLLQLCLPIFFEYCPWRTPLPVAIRLGWMRVWRGRRWRLPSYRYSRAYALLWLVSQPSSLGRAFAIQAIASIMDDADGIRMKSTLQKLVTHEVDVLNVLRFREAELRAVRPGLPHATSSKTTTAAWAPAPSAAVYARARVELHYCSRALELLEGGTTNKTPDSGGLRALLKRWIGRARTASRNTAASLGGQMA
ncbi:hypothetical protein EXIGLDRAFT_755510 [Exidia glandulosa HHB12029]|uniref:DUF6535 domain-containing protein n=1 Tax=Exidia glandulosa HHB12029 TaxID=1314781 RepID=A0A165C074_EXIGL|nr:hypothetical protein EXIGLDRAFT_755510 [Exidia glandulosa HHB12029]